MKGAARRIAVFLAAALMLSCCGGPKAPDLVLITIDTIRAGHLGCYGYFRETSPALDAFAGESILFERCIVPIATTLPSHLSFLTGVYPTEHDVTANTVEGAFRFVPSENLRSIAQVASDAGYRTAAVVSPTPLKHYTGVSAGFEFFAEPPGSQWRAEETTEEALRWLSEMPAEPYLLWVHYFDPHSPYDPPPPSTRSSSPTGMSWSI